MFASKLLTRTATIMAVLILALGGAQPAFAAPPDNDNFVNATVISTLPFEDFVIMSEASLEVGEPPIYCKAPSPSRTIWYSFTPTTSGSFSARIWTTIPMPAFAAYTSSSLTGLSPVGCRDTGDPLTFRAEVGTTYYFQVGVDDDTVRFYLEVSPPPEAYFYFYPYDPSVFDTLTFYDGSIDPANVGIEFFAWDFGDGTTSTDPYPYHQYTQDGDYTVQHSVTTNDGRTASTSQVVQVRTHDVAITKILAPISANAGQTRTITVSVSNKRYPEYVRVDLYKSAPGGYQSVASVAQDVTVLSGNRTTMFNFKYTFTSDDAIAKTVTFKAVANINVRDALPADNEIISSPPTKVPR